MIEGWWARNRRWIAAWGGALSLYLALRIWLFGTPLETPSAAEGVTAGLIPLRLLHYLSLLSFPWGVRSYYGPGELALSASGIVGGLLLVGLYAAFAGRRWDRWGAKAAAWAGAALLPVAGVVPLWGRAASGHHVYLASAGTCLLLGYLASRLASSPRWGRAALPLAAALALALAAGTAWQVRPWRDQLSLYRRISQDAPKSPAGPFNLGNELDRRGRSREAEEQYREALAREPRFPMALNNLGAIALKEGRAREALDFFDRAVALSPDQPLPRENRARALVLLGRGGEGEADLREAARLRAAAAHPPAGR